MMKKMGLVTADFDVRNLGLCEPIPKTEVTEVRSDDMRALVGCCANRTWLKSSVILVCSNQNEVLLRTAREKIVMRVQVPLIFTCTMFFRKIRFGISRGANDMLHCFSH